MVTDWAKRTARSQLTARTITFAVDPGQIIPFEVGQKSFVYYDNPPEGMPTGKERGRGWQPVIVEAVDPTSVTVMEQPKKSIARFDRVPTVLAPGGPISANPLAAAIASFATSYCEEGSEAHSSALDLLRRTPPRMLDAGPAPAGLPQGADSVKAVLAALRNLSNSYLAVQGPPGTGKTYLGSRVIDALVRDGWRIGVVAQSHKVVENLLGEIVDSGLPASVVAKEGDKSRPWTTVPKIGKWMDEQTQGYVVGGTAWTFCRGDMLDREPFDLMVIDEAGQFSLANTIAVSKSAHRLLLLGDPQQLPQVSQGSHPEPVDESALGHLLNGADTIPAEFGYFLETTWRMHDDVCEPVSKLSYRGALASADVTRERHLDGVRPGVHTHLVDHEGCKVHSPEEVLEVVKVVDDSLGRSWTSGDGETRPLDQSDVLIVAPYNRQVSAIRNALTDRNLPDVRVGTVDKLQGQQAPVVIVSLTASSAQEIPRGMDFLLMRNRLNVAVSRAQWACYLVYSPRLLDGAVTTVADLQRLAGLLLLSEGESHRAGSSTPEG